MCCIVKSMSSDLGGAQWRLSVQCVEMNSHRRRTLSGIMVTWMAKRIGKVGVLVSALKMDWWKTMATTHESVPDRFVPQTKYVARLGPPALDVRLWCDVCLVLGCGLPAPFIKWLGVATVVAKMMASDKPMYYFVRFL